MKGGSGRLIFSISKFETEKSSNSNAHYRRLVKGMEEVDERGGRVKGPSASGEAAAHLHHLRPAIVDVGVCVTDSYLTGAQ